MKSFVELRKELSELSPELLKRYKTKAKDSRDSHLRIAKDYRNRKPNDPKFPKTPWTDRMAKVHQRRADQHAKGISRVGRSLVSPRFHKENE